MLILICGQSRAGKTTYSQRFENVVHLDTSGAYRGVLRRVSGMEDVVVEGVYHRARDRRSLVEACGGHKKCIWLDTPKEVRATRPGYSEKGCNPPFEPPTYDEGWDEIEVIR